MPACLKPFYYLASKRCPLNVHENGPCFFLWNEPSTRRLWSFAMFVVLKQALHMAKGL